MKILNYVNIAIVVVLALYIAVFTGCSTFKPVIVEGWTIECNVMATIAKLEEDDKGKKLASQAMILCYKSIKRRDCQKEQFGVDEKTGKINPVDYNDARKYRSYTQCINEKS